LNRSRPWAVIIGGASIGALGSFATHSILPALSSIRADLHTHVGTTQLIVSVALLALGTGQLLVGPFSDRFGRRPVILSALALYFVASVAATFALDVSWLICSRALQAFGCGGAIAVSRATIMDYFGPERAAVGIAYTATAVLLVPMFAPTLGGYLAEFLGWRWIFAICSLLGAAVFVFTWIRIAETHAHPRNPASATPAVRSYLHSYGILLRSPGYMSFVAFGSLLMASMYTVITGAPYVIIDVMHLAPSTYGKMFLIPALGSFSGFFLAAKISRRLGSMRMMGIGVGLGLAASVLMAAMMLLH
jgi:MFS transporter, DHA1 family, multidrug resistance protein